MTTAGKVHTSVDIPPKNPEENNGFPTAGELDSRNKIRLGRSSTQPTEAFKRPKGE